ncbi:MAG: hypothetical protein ATN35_03375 [Epulopiscium sp. Nele67-Bin004]|nr:MAG: hypothetical protein ATN35_03375 [Epulopiscium sp. Nele67-Bin004]
MGRFNDIKVEKKLGIIMVGVATLNVILVVGILLIRNMLSTTELLERRFSAYSELNAALVQNKFDSASTTCNNIINYLEMSLFEVTYSEELSETSLLYGNAISSELSSIEEYMYSSVVTSVLNEPLFDAMGAFFEPNQFISNQEAYGFCIGSTNKLSLYKSYTDYVNEDWYAVPKETKQPYITDAWEGEQGFPVITVTIPIIKNDDFIGVVAVDLLLYEFSDTSVSDPNYPSLFSAVLTNNFDIVFNSVTFDKIGMSITNIVIPEDVQRAFEYAKSGQQFQFDTKGLQGENHKRYLYPIDAFGQTWWAHVGVERYDFYADTIDSTILSIVTTFFMMCVATALTVYYLKKYLRPLEILTQVSENIERGQLSINVSAPYSDDIGEIINRFNHTGKSLNLIVKEIEDVLMQMANGDFVIDDKVNGAYNGDFATIKTSMLNISQMLREALQKVNTTTNEVTNNAEEIAVAASNLAKSSSTQTELINDFVNTTEGMANAIKEINAKVEETSKTGIVAKDSALQGKEAMDSMLEAMTKITESSKTIASVLEIIEAITAQTNLLALNAAIEASRAGDAGRGFSVVANEIRELANRSSDTVKQIEQIIKSSLEDIAQGQEIANKTAISLIEVSNTIDTNVNLSDELLVMSDSQKESINELVENIKLISKGVTENAASAQESTAISEELAAQATHLESLMHQFKFS